MSWKMEVPQTLSNRYSMERQTKEEENNTKPQSGKQVTGIQMEIGLVQNQY